MRTKRWSNVILCVVLILLAGIGSAYAQNVQKAILNPSVTSLANAGDPLAVTIQYDCNDNTVTVFGIRVHYDSTKLTYVDANVLHAGGSMGAVQNRDEAATEDDGDTNTNKVLIIGYGDPFGGSWPNVVLPLNLVALNFVAAVAAPQTAVNVTASGTASGFTFEGTPADIGKVTPPVITPMDIPTAVLAIDGDDTVIDANAAEYVNEHITGAITADAVLPADKATRILVYGRDAAAALAFATSLVGQGYTNVAYLNDTFAAFAAAPATTVSDDKVQYKLTVNTVGAGAVTGNSADGFHNRNAEVNLVANPLTVTWSGNAPNGVVTMTAPQTVTATFEGAVNNPPVANAASFEVFVGDQLNDQLTGSDPDGDLPLTFAKVTGPATFIINPDGTFTYDNPQTPGEVLVTFKVTDSKGLDSLTTATVTITVKPVVTDKYTVNASAGPNGSISPSGTVEVNVGQAQTFTITPNSSSYVVEDVVVDNVSQGAITSYTFPTTTTGTHTISVTFKSAPINIYTVNASAGPNGSISPSGAVEVNVGQSQTFTITPNDGYVVDAVVVDSVSKGAITSYTFPTTTTGTHTIVATFKIEGTETPDGDGNCDNVTDIYDALLAAIIDMGNPDNVTVCDLDTLDVNQDGEVNTNDAIAIARYDVGLTCNCILDAKK